MNNTLGFYDKNATSFVQGTLEVDFAEIQNIFLGMLRPGASILDFGCGSGRDSLYFLNKGFQVQAIDGSKEMCRVASDFIGQPVKNMIFQDLEEVEAYDGIWACASILHLEKRDLKSVFEKMVTALKENGILYASFKYGTFEGDRTGRYYTDFTEATFADFLSQIDGISIEKQWLSNDVRKGKENEQWLNLILRKTNS